MQGNDDFVALAPTRSNSRITAGGVAGSESIEMITSPRAFSSPAVSRLVPEIPAEAENRTRGSLTPFA